MSSREDILSPLHIGIIMDGNGRWATARGKARTEGHLEGLKTARRIVEAAAKRGIGYLTLYVFSTENWKRAADEVAFIMGLVKQHLMREADFYKAHHIRIRHAGDIAALGSDIQAELDKAMRETAHFDGMQVVLALNYGGRDEIVRAVKKIINNKEKIINEETISGAMDNPDVPPPDFIIRTGAEKRVSNFLLWEGAYAELYFSPKLWPDFDEADLDAALEDFERRARRFGAV